MARAPATTRRPTASASCSPPPGAAGEAGEPRRLGAHRRRPAADAWRRRADPDRRTSSEALAAAREAKATFLISPTILEWNDGHAPPFTADRVKVQLDLRDPDSGEVVSTVTFENVSSFLSVADARPDALLDRTFDRAVTALVDRSRPT